MEENSFLLYGANGYTGELIARYASLYNLRPILAGRREQAIIPLAQKLGLPYKVFSLDDSAALTAALQEVSVVVHAAGPFHLTADQMVKACLRTRTHYLDINGDIEVFEALKHSDYAAKNAGIMVLPGVGFDVVPTDCMALWLKKSLPEATDLKLAFATMGGSISHGTATTMISKLGQGGAFRQNGQILPSRLAKNGIWVDFGAKKLFVASIPWGDIATAYFTTEIPNIECYCAIPLRAYRLLKWQFLFNWILRTSWLRRVIQKRIDLRPSGPGDDQRSRGLSLIWGQATGPKGEKVSGTMSGSEAYALTAHSSLVIAKKVLQGRFITGYQTPAKAFGENLVLEIPGMSRSPLQITEGAQRKEN
jgi:short subunit dehydrogenase-like uncharacterized protein